MERAIQHYEAALTVYTRAAFPQDWARTQHNLGNAYVNRIRGEREDNMDHAIAAFEAALMVLSREALPRDHVVTSRALGDALAARGDWAAARQTLGDAIVTVQDLTGDGLDDAEIQGVIDVAGLLFVQAAFVEARSGNGWRALETLEDGRARLLKTALRLNALSLSAVERRQLVDLRREVREQSSLLAREELPGDRSAILNHIAENNRHIRAIVERGRPPIEEQPVKTLAQTLLPAGGAIVVPIVSKLGTALVVVARERANLAATVHPLPSLTVARWLALLTGSAENAPPGGWLSNLVAFGTRTQVAPPERLAIWKQQVADTAGRLWTVIGRDLVAALAARGVADGARVIWLPPGVMGVIPIGLARDGETYLLDRYEIATLPSLRINTTTATTGPPSLAALVNPTGDLRFAAVEGALVASWFPRAARTVLKREETSVDHVLAALTGRSHWHLSSHGRFWWLEPEKSGISLAGGTVLSIRDLLTRLGQVSPRLVVLSACESGLNEIRDEYIGLPMALLAGGAQAAVGTQWPHGSSMWAAAELSAE